MHGGIWKGLVGVFLGLTLFVAFCGTGVYFLVMGLHQTMNSDTAKARACLARGTRLLDNNDAQQAIAEFNKAIVLKPDLAAAFYKRGLAWDELRDYDKAIADYDEAARLNPGDPLVYFDRGRAWSAKNDFDKAISDWTETLRLRPNERAAYHNRGFAWLSKREYDKAIADFSETIRLQPNYGMGYVLRGRAWVEKKNFDQAVIDFNQAIQLNSTDYVAIFQRGIAFEKQGDYAKALIDWNVAIRLEPNSASMLNSRAWFYATVDDEPFQDGKQAVEDATKACELTGWDDASTIDTLAAAYAATGDFAKAVETQTKATELAPQNMKADFAARLELFRAGKEYRENPQAVSAQ